MRLIGRILLWLFAAIGGLVVVAGLAVTAFTLSMRTGPPELPERAVLHLDLTEAPAETRGVAPFFDPAPPPTLREVTTALARAADDPRIAGVSAEVGGAWFGVAQAQELAAALRDFRASGKPAVAFAEDLGGLGDATRDIAVATAFGELWLQPSGGVGLTGIALQAPFFGEALEELEIEPQVGQRHEYKGGVDPLVRRGYAPEVRRSLQRVVDGWLDQLVGIIAGNRDLEPARVRALVDRGPLRAEEARSAGLVDRLGYRDQADAALADRLGGPPRAVAVAPYLEASAPEEEAGTTVALIQGVGPIEPGDGEPNPLLAGETFRPGKVARALAAARTDESVDGVLFRVASPGGAYGPSDAVRREVRRLRESGKPVVVAMGDIAASGGYFVALDADRIVAQPGTLTGSIGVYSGKLATRGLWQRLGVAWDEVAAGENAGMWSMIDRFEADERARFDAMLDAIYADFTGHVGRARGLAGDALDDAARGRIFLGADAKEVGLVDVLGGLDTALMELRGLMGTAPDARIDLRRMPAPKSPWERLLEWIDGGGTLDELVAAGLTRAVADRVESVTGDLAPLRAATAGALATPPLRLAR